MDCVYCGSSRAVRNGTRSGLQRFLCRDCGRQFNERSGTPFAGMKYKPEEVVLALRLRFNYRLSSREASELMAELGHPISKNIVPFWADRFHASFQVLHRRARGVLRDPVHRRAPRQAQGREGLRIRRGGRPQERHRPGANGEEGRGGDGEGAEEDRGGLTPDVIVSDGALAYPPAIAEAVPGARHVVAQFRETPVSHRGQSATVSNNLLERLNGALRGWVRTLRGFKSLAAGYRALTVLQAVYNLLRPHQGLGGLTPFQAAGGGRPNWNTLSKVISTAL